MVRCCGGVLFRAVVVLRQELAADFEAELDAGDVVTVSHEELQAEAEVVVLVRQEELQVLGLVPEDSGPHRTPCRVHENPPGVTA